MSGKAGKGYWILIGIGFLLGMVLLVGQAGALIDYDFTVAIGLQESAEELTDVGVLWAKAFAFGDTLIYLPLLVAGLIGLLRKKKWGINLMFGVLALTAYWPLVWLYMFHTGEGLISLSPDKLYGISTPLVAFSIYGLWGIWHLLRNQTSLID